MNLEWKEVKGRYCDYLECTHGDDTYRIYDDGKYMDTILKNGVRYGAAASIEEAKQFVIDNLEE